MAQDYHIYLHSEGNGSSGNKTTPFSSREDNENSAFQNITSTAFNGAKTIASGNAVNTGVATLGKIAPVVALTVVSIKVLDKIMTIGLSHVAEYTGNYKYSVDYNNFKTEMYNAIHPIRYWLSIQHQRAQFNKQNKEIAQQDKLIGNSILKDFNIGV